MRSGAPIAPPRSGRAERSAPAERAGRAERARPAESRRAKAYRPIADYGVIGNMHTAALVSRGGSIDWFCYPRFDSPSVFAAILDAEKGGRFTIEHALEEVICKQVYWPDTNVLITRFLASEGVGEVTDFMPVVPRGEAGHRWLVRWVRSVRGAMPFRVDCRPAFNYARDRHEVVQTAAGVRFRSERLALDLTSTVPLGRADDGVAGDFVLEEGQTAVFVLRESGPEVRGTSEAEAERLFRGTTQYWRRWLGQCTYHGRWREIVHRSALALKLLTFEPTGAIVASPTCSLPETLGGERNWDYRYTWIRDAAFTVYAFLRIGFTAEATHFMEWIEKRCREHRGDRLQIMYAIDGRAEIDEEVLDHLEGYRGSRPVRIGNAAYHQLQLDIFGELMDSVYLHNKYASPISYDLWTSLRPLADWVSANWMLEDEGIWEVRGGRRHFVYSKLMCWVALDRALRLAGKRSFPAPHDTWLASRDAIYQTIMSDGWSERRKAFAQSLGSETLDAANLIMPLVFFVSPTDPRMLATIDAIYRTPLDGGLVSDGLVYRYDVEKTPDGIRGEEGTFNMCTFWLVEALTRAGTVHRERLDQARVLFERMLGYANHLGLYAEETGPRGEHLGNFPQAFTHLALISAAFNLDRALGVRE
jgi:GH15 family glucan-1,4-alpha-glucosidase